MIPPPKPILGGFRLDRSRLPVVQSNASLTSTAATLNFHNISLIDFPPKILPFASVVLLTRLVKKPGDFW
jgi:hypothetical protein